MSTNKRSRRNAHDHYIAQPLADVGYRHSNTYRSRSRSNLISSEQSKIKHRLQNRSKPPSKRPKTTRNKTNRHSIYDDDTSDTSSEDEPIIKSISTTQKAPLNRIPKYSSKETKVSVDRVLPQKRRMHCSIHKTHSNQTNQPRKKRKMDHTNNTDQIHENKQDKAQRTSPNKIITNAYCSLNESIHKTNTTQIISTSSAPKSDTTNHSLSETPKNINPQHTSPSDMNIKPVSLSGCIDLISDSEDEIISNLKEEPVQTEIAASSSQHINKDKNHIEIDRNGIDGIQCAAHNELEYSNAIYIWMIPNDVLEHQMIYWFQKRFNITVTHCEPFELDTDHEPFKKCRRLEMGSVNIKQRNDLIEMITNECISMDHKVSTPPTPKICSAYLNENNNNKNKNTNRLNMDTPQPEWINKFRLLSYDTTIMISAKEMIETSPICDRSNEIHMDDESTDTHQNDIMDIPLSVGLSNNEAWTFNLCVEEVLSTRMATSGDIVPMIQVIADKTGLLCHERCDEMVWFQRSGTIPKRYCEWIQNDMHEITYCENCDLKFLSSDTNREKKQLTSFRKQLNKHRAVFINPCLFDGEYVIGIKVLGVIDLFGGGTVIKSKIVKMTISSAMSDIPDHSFSVSTQSAESIDLI